MKELLSLISCLFVIFLSAGCDKQNLKSSNPPQPAAQENEFPEVMVGVWQAEVSEISKWGIKFEPDGSILKIIHFLAGPINLSEGGVYEEGPDPNTFAYFAIGPCKAKYNPANRQLSVKIFLDAFHMRLPAGDLEGRSEDYFDGPVSEDGKTWTVSWRNYGWLEGATPPDPNVIEANPEKLVFIKTDAE